MTLHHNAMMCSQRSVWHQHCRLKRLQRSARLRRQTLSLPEARRKRECHPHHVEGMSLAAVEGIVARGHSRSVVELRPNLLEFVRGEHVPHNHKAECLKLPHLSRSKHSMPPSVAPWLVNGLRCAELLYELTLHTAPTSQEQNHLRPCW